MKIVDIVATPIRVPFQVPFHSSHTPPIEGTARTVIQITTDTGIVGLGETMRGKPTCDLIEGLLPYFLGQDPFDLERILEEMHMVPFFRGYLGYAAIGGLEMACWDIMAKHSGVPLYKLLGGLYRRDIPIDGVLTNYFFEEGHQSAKDESLQQIVQSSVEMVERFGFTSLKQKGSKDWRYDVKVMQALREAHGDAVDLRIDPNWAWSVEDSIRAAKELEPARLQWLEDPTYGIEGMARVAAHTHLPLATNMCVVTPEDIAPALRLGAVDVILGDCHKWGGIVPTKKLAAVCEAFGVGMSLHSGAELGISTAANLHIVASTPVIRYAVDSLYYLIESDIIEQTFELVDGSMPVPEEPGLGVSLDEDKLAEYNKLYLEKGEIGF